MIFSTKPNRRETLLGGIYLALNIFVLPGLITYVHSLLGAPLRAGQLNFIFFCMNFLAVIVIFRKFLAASLRDALKVPLATLWYSILAYLGNQTLGEIIAVLCWRVYPGFANVNDGSIAVMLQQDFLLMAAGTMFLVPVAEEVLYRGLLFRGLYDRSPLAAYLVSTVVFAVIHVMGYLGQYEPVHLLLCFIQYLPAGYCLAFAYRYSGSIVAPIFVHIMTNIAAVSAMR